MSECHSRQCHDDAEKTVIYGRNTDNPFSYGYCEPHARKEVQKHEDAEIVGET